MKFWDKTTTFLREVRAEMKKVTFPSRDEVVSTTIVVVVTSFVFAIYLFLADQVIQRVFNSLYGMLG
jgi:preprotein translocase subunit SecE